MRDLLEKMMKFAGEKVGQKPGDQWRGSDKAPPGKKLVGDSILKDLSKGKTPKTREQELSEEFQAFLEAEFKDTVDKRPARKNARPARGHEPKLGYKTVKADENVDEGTPVNVNALLSRADHSGTTVPWWARISDTNYMGSSSEEKNLKYKLYFPEMFRRNNLDYHFEGDPKKALFAAKQLGFEQDDQGKWYFPVYNTLPVTKNKITRSKYYFGEKPTKVLPKPEEIAESSMSEKDIELQDYRSMSHKEFQTAYGMTKTEWINKNKVLVIQNPSIKKGLGLEEDSDHGPVEARWMVTVSDDEGQHLKTYHNEFPSLSDAKKAYENTPYASDFKYKPVKKDTNEAIDSDIVQPMGQDTFNRAGYNPILDKNDYLKRRSETWNLMSQTTDPQTKEEARQRILDLDKQARAKKYIQSESRAHNIIATKLKNLERERKFAKGELKIPTPQERQAQLKKLEKSKSVKEFVATPTQGTADQTMQQKTQAQDPKQAQAVAQATQAMKSATGSSAPTTTLAKALNTASQGKPVVGQEAAALEPLMKDMATVAQDPNLSGQFKSLISQINQAQLKQK